jgi:hypothetical protein
VQALEAEVTSEEREVVEEKTMANVEWSGEPAQLAAHLDVIPYGDLGESQPRLATSPENTYLPCEGWGFEDQHDCAA